MGYISPEQSTSTMIVSFFIIITMMNTLVRSEVRDMSRTTLQIVPDEQREKDRAWNRYILYQFEFEVKHKKNIKEGTRMVLDMTRGRITKFLPNYAFLTRRLEEICTL